MLLVLHHEARVVRLPSNTFLINAASIGASSFTDRLQEFLVTVQRPIITHDLLVLQDVLNVDLEHAGQLSELLEGNRVMLIVQQLVDDLARPVLHIRHLTEVGQRLLGAARPAFDDA